MSHVTYKWVISRINESCHVSMSHVTCAACGVLVCERRESARAHHSVAWHDIFICVTWHIHVCDMMHSYVWHDSFLCVMWLIHMCDMTHSHVWFDSVCVPWLVHICEMCLCRMTHSYVCHDPCICVPWPMHMCDMTYSYILHDSFTCVPWHIHMCDMTYLYVWHDTFTCMTWLIPKILPVSFSLARSLSSTLLPSSPSPSRAHSLPLFHPQTFLSLSLGIESQRNGFCPQCLNNTIRQYTNHSEWGRWAKRLDLPQLSRANPVKWHSTLNHDGTHKSIWINKSSVNPKSTSNQSSQPCTVLQYSSRWVYPQPRRLLSAMSQKHK